MNWLDKMERKFGRYAIPDLMRYIIILYAGGFVLNLVKPELYYQYLSLNAGAILHGQIWRVVTFIIAPPTTSILWILLVLSAYYFIGRQLEMAWGAFRFNLYYFSGMFFHVVAAILVYGLTGLSLPLQTGYLNMSLFFVFAMIYPDAQFRLNLIIPIKAKWLAVLNAVYFAYPIVQAFLPAYSNSPYGIIFKANALASVVSMLNVVIFFLSSRKVRPYTPKQMKRKREFKKNVKQAGPVVYGNGARHRCAVCGRTELDDPKLEFRYCSKCNGNYEYCQDHLFTHKHVE